jgi:RNA polymerase sigma-70 factor (ECF subfamily)
MQRQPAAGSAALDICLARLRSGDAGAKAAVIECACERLRHLARRLLGEYPGVRRWEETDDVLQQALIRLDRALDAEQPETPAAFFGLAAVQIRRQLVDLARRYYGPQGLGSRHDTQDRPNGNTVGLDPVDNTAGPATMLFWAEFHEAVGELPDDERAVFDLIYYQEASQEQVGQLLGVSVRTVKRRWQSARLILHDRLRSTGKEIGP